MARSKPGTPRRAAEDAARQARQAVERAARFRQTEVLTEGNLAAHEQQLQASPSPIPGLSLLPPGHSNSEGKNGCAVQGEEVADDIATGGSSEILENETTALADRTAALAVTGDEGPTIILARETPALSSSALSPAISHTTWSSLEQAPQSFSDQASPSVPEQAPSLTSEQAKPAIHFFEPYVWGMVNYADMAPRGELPYFAHEPLNESLFTTHPPETHPVGCPLPDAPGLHRSGAAVNRHAYPKGAVPKPSGAVKKSSKSSESSSGRSSAPADNLRLLTRRRPARGVHVKSTKITIDNLDSDDELMMQMRKEGFTDTEIAARFAIENRRNYPAKSIASRRKRVVQHMARRQDQLLEQNTASWTPEQDALLREAEAAADTEIEMRIASLKARRTKLIAKNLNGKLTEAKFSAVAVDRRLEELRLQDGIAASLAPPTATPAPEAEDETEDEADRDDEDGDNAGEPDDDVWGGVEPLRYVY